MKIGAGINSEKEKVIFIGEDESGKDSIYEIEVSDSFFEHAIKEFGGEGNMDKVSDGYHTFEELYYHRMILFATICNVYKEHAWKSWKHHDNTMYDNYFIVGVDTPEGQYSYHYHKDEWDFFNVIERENAPEWDGHKPDDIKRLLSLNSLLVNN